ncbi:MAG TPA: LuxR C-terminal-related transcriptional regulator, partial [Ktedonobacteraceae bacterium]|nr:LuxR C-terminal-related transcriptional regulator [Ktedonobacteraceae bacterium]
TAEETRTFFHEVIGVELPDDTIQQVTVRTEGWLVGLRLLGLSLPLHTDPLRLLREIRGDQRYIMDYLTEEVLRRQPQEVQTFLLCTSILERLTASLCDAVMQQCGSQQMLERLEQTNLFVVSLDSKRQWYRYHALFAEVLRYQLEQIYTDQVTTLHYRASLWYAEHHQTTEAVLHAFRAQEWPWAMDLLEQKGLQLATYTWGASERELVLLRKWLEQLPIEVIGSRPRVSLTCARLLWQVASPTMLEAWLKTIEGTLSTSLTTQTQEDLPHPMLGPKAQQEQENLLADAIALRAFLQSFGENAEAVFPLCQQTLLLLSVDNYFSRILLAWAEFYAYYYSSANDAEAAIRSGQQAISIAQMSGKGTIFAAIGVTAQHMKEAGQLHEAELLVQQATQLRIQQAGLLSPEAGWPAVVHAEILRERNQLDVARTVIEEVILLCKQSRTPSSLLYIFLGYAVLLRVSLSRGDLETAHAALREFECISKSMNQISYLYLRSFYTTVDQVRLWLVCGQREQATHWAQELDLEKRSGTPFIHEREDVACVRVLLANKQPDLALQRLGPVLQRATAGKRWGHVIEVRLLQALAHQMCQKEIQALDALSEAVRLAEPEGYIRSFVDEGAPMGTLLYHLRKRDRKSGPTPYLDTVLAAFQQEIMEQIQVGEQTKAQALPDPLSQRELQVLQLIAQGASNQEIAQELALAIDTVKRHVSHIFSKLGANNRVQAVKQARNLSLLDEEH